MFIVFLVCGHQLSDIYIFAVFISGTQFIYIRDSISYSCPPRRVLLLCGGEGRLVVYLDVVLARGGDQSQTILFICFVINLSFWATTRAFGQPEFKLILHRIDKFRPIQNKEYQRDFRSIKCLPKQLFGFLHTNRTSINFALRTGTSKVLWGKMWERVGKECEGWKTNGRTLGVPNRDSRTVKCTNYAWTIDGKNPVGRWTNVEDHVIFDCKRVRIVRYGGKMKNVIDIFFTDTVH